LAPDAGFDDIYMTAGLGSLFGAIVPTAAIYSLAGSLSASGVAYAMAGPDQQLIAMAWQFGGLAGALGGEFRMGASAGAKYGAARALQSGLVRVGPDLMGAGVGGIIGYNTDHTVASALHGATIGMFVAGIAGGLARGLPSVRRAVAPNNGIFSNAAGEPMDPALFRRIQKAWESKPGRIMLADENSAMHLNAIAHRAGLKHVGGQTLNKNVIFLQPNPTASSVFEELIHTAQLRRGMNPKAQVLQMEIEAAERLIRNRRPYNIPRAQTYETITRLRALRQSARQ